MSKSLVSDPIYPAKPGDLVADRYRIDRVLGAGGMGVVFAATDVQLDRRVALKFLLPTILEQRDLLGRFAREARAAAKLQSEHAVRILDVSALEKEVPYMVLEYLDGKDLAQLLTARGPLPYEQAVAYVLEASEAVAEAHSLGIIHRDLKPANLFLAERTTGTPLIKVLDFGLSKFSEPTIQDNVSSTSSMLGSPAYMSPEQLLSSGSVDARSDIWSLGAVLYELMTTRTPFPHERMPELVAAILQGTMRSMDASLGIPPDLAAVVRRCLDKEPERRFANIGELAKALSPFAPTSSRRSIERIDHLMHGSKSGSGSAAAPPMPEPTSDLDEPRKHATTESVPGASQTIQLVRPDVADSAGKSATPRKLTRWMVGVLAVVLAVAARFFFSVGAPPIAASIPSALPIQGSSGIATQDKKETPQPLLEATHESAGLTTPPPQSAPSGAVAEPPRKNKTGAAASVHPPGSSTKPLATPPSAPPAADDPLTRLKPL